MIRIRAKFQCQSETRHSWSSDAKTYKFAAAYDPNILEDESYAKATPTGSVEILVDNPAAQFTVGAYYYLDFTPVPVDAA